MFNRAQLYSEFNVFQRKDAEDFLLKYKDVMKWDQSSDCSLLDIGCGPGDVLFDFVLPLLPENYSRILGVDVSPNMINYSKEAYQHKFPKANFKVMDIGDENLEITEQFDHVTSFYCLNFIPNQRQAITNIFNLVKPGGDAFLLIMARINIWYILDILAANPKWRPHILKEDPTLSPYRHDVQPEEELRKFLKEVGFNVMACEGPRRKITYSKEQFIGFMSVNGKLNLGTARNVYDEFYCAVFGVMKDLDLLEEKDGEVRISMDHSCVVAYVKKDN